MSDESTTFPPGWHADPVGRHQLRYWDGRAWTEHVSDGGVQSADPLDAGLADRIDQGLGLFSEPDAAAVRDMVTATGTYRGAGITDEVRQGDGTLWGEPILVVNQKAKLIEVTNQYSVFDQHGNQVAYVSEVGQSVAKKALRVLTSLDQFMTHRLEICGLDGTCQLRLTRPAKVMKSTIIVEHPDGGEVGRIVQANVFGKIRFALQANGQELGSINAENWRAWNFNIQDASGTEIARITKTWEGLAKTMFTTADNYVVQIHTAIPQPLLSLVVAAALSVDTALKQDSRGLG
jgi:uncharacterized protein YxjI